MLGDAEGGTVVEDGGVRAGEDFDFERMESWIGEEAT